ncbi:hypothetical protein AAL_03067 [Moelleriella libera RCEF 2490]|uniref:Ecp2 effector protein-like domain-containing protein n=1 Tax=Moelleriella libera RCEF 2490 TaxID=1081109 RepID=A0A168E924_9HYPO|nr:hypothetical protein AAL_03067 [Moelleriella libera RCEF 2490]
MFRLGPSLWAVAAIVVSLANLVWSLPASGFIPNSPGFLWHPSDNTQTTCDQSTFAESTDLAPASWKQCAGLYSSWTSQNGTFDLTSANATGYMPILQTRDCALSVKPADPSKGPFTLGDGDVKTLLDTSLRQFSEGSDLRVMGMVKCAAAGGDRDEIDWRISKP